MLTREINFSNLCIRFRHMRSSMFQTTSFHSRNHVGHSILIAHLRNHIRYINSEALVSKLQIFQLHCLAIPRRELSAKKTIPNREKWSESLGVMLEFKYFERGLFIGGPKLDISNLIDLNVDLHVKLRGLGSVYEKFDDWTGPEASCSPIQDGSCACAKTMPDKAFVYT